MRGSSYEAALVKARPTETVSAAEDDIPAPIGTVETISPSKPLSGAPCSWSSRATAATYLPQPSGGIGGGASTGSSIESPKAAERSRIVASAAGAHVTSGPRHTGTAT